MAILTQKPTTKSAITVVTMPGARVTPALRAEKLSLPAAVESAIRATNTISDPRWVNIKYLSPTAPRRSPSPQMTISAHEATNISSQKI